MSDYITNMWNKLVSLLQENGWKILLSICLIIICFFLIKLISFLLRKILYKTRIDDAVVVFYSTIVTFLLWAGVIILVAAVLEIPTNSLIVGLSSVALAVGLALKDSLANLTNGILIIFNKPFKRGDHVSVNGVEGRILNITLLTTEMICFDNRKVVMPNSSIVNGTVINYTSLPTRRVDQTYSVSYDEDIDFVKKVLEDTIKDIEIINKNPTPAVFLSAHNSSSLDFTIRVWVNTENYWDVYNDLPTKVFKAFKKHNISIPYNQMDVHVVGDNK